MTCRHIDTQVGRQADIYKYIHTYIYTYILTDTHAYLIARVQTLAFPVKKKTVKLNKTIYE